MSRLTRDGQHSELVTIKLLRCMPWSPMYLCSCGGAGGQGGGGVFREQAAYSKGSTSTVLKEGDPYQRLGRAVLSWTERSSARTFGMYARCVLFRR